MKPHLRKMLEFIADEIKNVDEEDEYGFPDISWRALEDWEDTIRAVLASDEEDTCESLDQEF